MRPRFLAAAAAFASLALLTAGRAEAYDVLAVPCLEAPLTCGVGGVSFEHVDALPIEWSFDTGWVPQGSPLQVHIWADIWADTYVDLSGALVMGWPPAMVLAAPGRSEGGKFGFHYGADFGAQGKISVSVLGQTFKWQGDLPYVPQFDFQLKDDRIFDAWAYDPGIKISGITQKQTLATVSIGDIVGGSIPGIDGGFLLDVAMELDATYVTDQVVVQTVDGAEVAGGSFTAPDGLSSTPYLNGPNLELDIHPEGRVHYEGVLHLVPTFYVSLLGKDWQIPIVDIPIGFPITDTTWEFDKKRVHFPLPDLSISDTVLDFGEVEVGMTKSLDFQLWNAGEALAAASFWTSDAAVFPLQQTGANVDPGNTAKATVSFVPATAGAITGTIDVVSNDPNTPTQTITLKGNAKSPPAPPPDDTEDAGTTTHETEPVADQDGSCACRAAGDPRGGAGALWVAALGAAALVRRRRRG